MRRHALSILLIAIVMGLLLAACGEESVSPDADPPILAGFDTLPKQIVTIALTPTPTPVVAGGESVVVAAATPTLGPPRATPTLTPYVGIFLGQATSESGEPVPTLAPFVIDSAVSGVVSGGSGAPVAGGTCGTPVASTFSSMYAAVQDRLGCPITGGVSISPMVTQPFERGNMFWRSDTRQIYALASNGQYWQIVDSWNESMPVDDPAFAPPGGLLQPVRGFGLIWRSTTPLRDALGWASLPEAQYTSFWQDFERGAMFLGEDGHIYALFTAEGQHSGPLS